MLLKKKNQKTKETKKAYKSVVHSFWMNSDQILVAALAKKLLNMQV